MKNRMAKHFTGLCIFMGAMLYSISVFADTSNPWGDIGIEGGNADTSGLLNELDGWVMFFLALGGLWIVASLIFAGIRLAAAQTNPQSRSQAFIGLAMVFVGGVIIYNAWTFASYMTSLGGMVLLTPF